MAELVVNRYASSLFDVASEYSTQKENFVAKISEEFSFLATLFKENPDYLKLMSSPIVSNLEKHKLCEGLLRESICLPLYNFILILIDNNRFSSFLEIQREFKAICEEKEGLLSVEVVSAVLLSPETEQKLVKKLEEISKKRISVKNIVDPSIIGGLLIKYNNTQVDSTIKSQLNDMRTKIREVTI